MSRNKFNLIILILYQSLCFTYIANNSIYQDTLYPISRNINYFIALLLPIWAWYAYNSYNHLLIKQTKLFLKRLHLASFIFILLAIIQLLINTETTSFIPLRRLIMSVTSSISLVTITLFYCVYKKDRVQKIVYHIWCIFTLNVLLSVLTPLFESGQEEIFGITRTMGIAGQANIFGGMCLMSFCLSLYIILFKKGNLFKKSILLFCLLIAIYGGLLSGSYSVLSLFVITSLIISSYYFTRNRFIVFYISALIISITSVFMVKNIDATEYNFKTRTVIETLTGLSTIESVFSASTIILRQSLFFSGIDKIIERPIRGYGIDERRVDSFRSDINKYLNHVPHNSFLVVSLQLGIFGGITILTFYLLVFRFIGLIKNEKDYKIVLVFFVILLWGDSFGTTVSFFDFGGVLFAPFLIIVLMIAIKNSNQKIRKPSSL